ncbi:MAG: hypothetical protein CMJ19_20020 [Phycisphaeraceae bacterium]|nr:hypothetical protein [Phycisphaeraceae bacterium]
MKQTSRILISACLIACMTTVTTSAQPTSSQSAYGRYTPTAITKSRLRKLYKALTEYRQTFDAMPKSVNELLDLGYITNKAHLVDARHPLLRRELMADGPVDQVAPFRMVQTWREGAIATTDQPRDGQWIILNHDGSIVVRPVASKWLGRYTPKLVTDQQLEAFVDHPASRLGAVLSTATTDSGRTGLGVDRIIPGFSRNRVDFFDIRHDADLMHGDLILSVNGKHFDTLEEYEAYANANPPVTFSFFQRPILEIIRNGEIKTVCALDRNEHFPALSTTRAIYETAKICMNKTGPGAIRVSSENADGPGIRIKKTSTDYTGRYLQPGDILLRVDDKPVPRYLPSFYTQPAGSKVELIVKRQNKMLRIVFPLDQTSKYTLSNLLDSIQMGILDLTSVRQRHPRNPEYIGIDLWLMGLHQTSGPDIAIREAQRLCEEDERYEIRQVKAWAHQLDRARRYSQGLQLVDDALKQFDDPRDKAECLALRIYLLMQSGRIDDAVDHAKVIPIADKQYEEAAHRASGILMQAGYPVALLDILKVYIQAKPEDEQLKEGIQMLKEHIQDLDKSMQE